MSKLYDAYGHPVDLALLKQELAAPSLMSVRQVLSAHPSSGLTPERLARLLRASEEGDAEAYLELAEDMEEKDLNYRSQLQTRKLACAGLELEVKSASESAEDKKAADLVREAVGGMELEDALTDSLDALGKGYAVLEISWDQEGATWTPLDLVWRDPRWFVFSMQDGNTLLMRDLSATTTDGTAGASPLAPYKFVVHKPRLKAGIPIRGGLARASAWAFLFGNYVLKDWVGFCELFGQPIRVGLYPAGVGQEQIDILKQAVSQIGTDAAAVIPTGMEIKFVEAATKGTSSELYEHLLRYLDERVTIAVLGQTLTSGQTRGGGGSMALGKVHNEVRKDLLKADARQLSATLNRCLVRPIVDLNLGPRDHYPKVNLHVAEPQDLTALAEQLDKLVPLGLEVGQKTIQDKWGLPAPKEGEKLLQVTGKVPDSKPTEADLQTATESRHLCPHCQAAHGRGLETPDAADLLTDQLEQESAPAMAALLEPVRRLVMGAHSFQEISNGLLELYPGMPTEDFAATLTQAMTAATLAGRFDVASPARTRA